MNIGFLVEELGLDLRLIRPIIKILALIGLSSLTIEICLRQSNWPNNGRCPVACESFDLSGGRTAYYLMGSSQLGSTVDALA